MDWELIAGLLSIIVPFAIWSGFVFVCGMAKGEVDTKNAYNLYEFDRGER